MAEHCGLGFVDCGVLVPKEKQMKNIEMIALPRTSTKEVYGRVTHVSTGDCFFNIFFICWRVSWLFNFRWNLLVDFLCEPAKRTR